MLLGRLVCLPGNQGLHTHVLQALKAGIDVAALEQHVAAGFSLQDLAAQLGQKEAALSRCMHHLPPPTLDSCSCVPPDDAFVFLAM